MNSCSTFHSVFFYIASLYFSTEYQSKRTATISDQSNRRTYPGFIVCGCKVTLMSKDCRAKRLFSKRSGGSEVGTRRDTRLRAVALTLVNLFSFCFHVICFCVCASPHDQKSIFQGDPSRRLIVGGACRERNTSTSLTIVTLHESRRLKFVSLTETFGVFLFKRLKHEQIECLNEAFLIRDDSSGS